MRHIVVSSKSLHSNAFIVNFSNGMKLNGKLSLKNLARNLIEVERDGKTNSRNVYRLTRGRTYVYLKQHPFGPRVGRVLQHSSVHSVRRTVDQGRSVRSVRGYGAHAPMGVAVRAVWRYRGFAHSQTPHGRGSSGSQHDGSQTLDGHRSFDQEALRGSTLPGKPSTSPHPS